MSRHSRNNQEGFTITELAVSIVIMSIILTIVVSKQSSYTEGTALTNLADEIGATISQAQVYGIGVKEFSAGSSEFSASYGLVFNLPTTGGSNNAYIYFADRDPAGATLPNQTYDGTWACPTGGATDECLEKTNISRNNIIDDVCAVIASSADDCTNNVSRIDVSFARPSTEAQLRLFNTVGASFSPLGLIGAKVILKSPSGLIRSVTVYKTGQVSIQ